MSHKNALHGICNTDAFRSENFKLFQKLLKKVEQSFAYKLLKHNLFIKIADLIECKFKRA